MVLPPFKVCMRRSLRVIVKGYECMWSRKKQEVGSTKLEVQFVRQNIKLSPFKCFLPFSREGGFNSRKGIEDERVVDYKTENNSKNKNCTDLTTD